MTRVSVIIPTFNPGRLIDSAIDSVMAQQTSASVEIIVVDDGSADGTAQRVRDRYPAVTVVEQANSGTAAARNAGLQRATGDVIALLDQDDVWDADKLERQLPLFADASVGMVHAGGRFRNALGDVTSVERGLDSLDVHDVIAWCWIIQSTALVRAELMRRLEGFDEQLTAADDWDLWIRIAAESRLAAVPDALVSVLVHEGNQSNDAERMFRSAAGVIAKHDSLHPGCPRCRQAAREADLRNRQEYYRRMRELSKRARRNGRRLEPILLSGRALRRHPRALVETLRFHWVRRRVVPTHHDR